MERVPPGADGRQGPVSRVVWSGLVWYCLVRPGVVSRVVVGLGLIFVDVSFFFPQTISASFSPPTPWPGCYIKNAPSHDPRSWSRSCPVLLSRPESPARIPPPARPQRLIVSHIPGVPSPLLKGSVPRPLRRVSHIAPGKAENGTPDHHSSTTIGLTSSFLQHHRRTRARSAPTQRRSPSPPQSCSNRTVS